MKHKLDIDNWVRKDHFHFFNQFEEPFYGVCVTIDCTKAYAFAKKEDLSFFLYYLYQSLAAANATESFRLRIDENNEVYNYDRIDAGSTIGRSNGTFGYGTMKYHPTFEAFLSEATKVVEEVQQATGLVRESAANIIRCSSLPWIDFTSISHARMYSVKDSCPRISFGKLTTQDGKRTMPVSIHVHHALVDGLNVGQYVDCFQEMMNGRD